MKRNITLVSMILAALVPDIASGQPAMAFEAASVRPTLPGGRTQLKIDDSRAEYAGFTIQHLITQAYGLDDYRIIGPAWIKTQKFDVLAKLPSGSSRDHLPEMMQRLLADRFKLAVHQETRELQVYALLVSKNGSKLKQSRDVHRVEDEPPSSIDPTAVVMTLDQYAEFWLSLAVAGPVVNLTGLKGTYTMDVGPLVDETTRLRLARIAAAKVGESAIGVTSDLADSPVVAIVDALGLKLERRTLPLSVIVIDHMDKAPTEN